MHVNILVVFLDVGMLQIEEISLYLTIQFSVSTVSMSKTVQFQTIQFSISTQFK